MVFIKQNLATESISAHYTSPVGGFGVVVGARIRFYSYPSPAKLGLGLSLAKDILGNSVA